jgi:hypothetical protein
MTVHDKTSTHTPIRVPALIDQAAGLTLGVAQLATGLIAGL